MPDLEDLVEQYSGYLEQIETLETTLKTPDISPQQRNIVEGLHRRAHEKALQISHEIVIADLYQGGTQWFNAYRSLLDVNTKLRNGKTFLDALMKIEAHHASQHNEAYRVVNKFLSENTTNRTTVAPPIQTYDRLRDMLINMVFPTQSYLKWLGSLPPDKKNTLLSIQAAFKAFLNPESSRMKLRRDYEVQGELINDRLEAVDEKLKIVKMRLALNNNRGVIHEPALLQEYAQLVDEKNNLKKMLNELNETLNQHLSKKYIDRFETQQKSEETYSEFRTAILGDSKARIQGLIHNSDSLLKAFISGHPEIFPLLQKNQQALESVEKDYKEYRLNQDKRAPSKTTLMDTTARSPLGRKVHTASNLEEPEEQRLGQGTWVTATPSTPKGK